MTITRTDRHIRPTTTAEPQAVEGVVAGSRAQPAASLIARWAGGAVLAGHGLIHLMGVALLWELGQPGELRYADMSPVPGSAAGILAGVVWLTGAALFTWAAALLVARRLRWRAAALAALAVSVPVLGPAASMTSVGLALDGVILLVVVLTSGPTRQVPQHTPGQEL
ncbi:MAG TPA: hypothetical protein VIJ15_03140 [Dermatophilaceae bacterium]